MRRRFERNGQHRPRDPIAELSSIRPIDRYGERWYPIIEETRDEIVHCLSVTTALDAYPKDPWLLDWMKKQGPMADRIRDEKANIGIAADRGTQLLDKGATIRRNDYSEEVYKALVAYRQWREDKKPEILAQQASVWSIRDRVAGTLDKIAEIAGELHLVEVKKTSAIRRTHVIQAQVYSHLLNLMGIPVKYSDVLRLGTRHKSGYEYVSEAYDPGVFNGPFRCCLELWRDAHDGRFEPKPEEALPETISLNGESELCQRNAGTGWRNR